MRRMPTNEQVDKLQKMIENGGAGGGINIGGLYRHKITIWGFPSSGIYENYADFTCTTELFLPTAIPLTKSQFFNMLEIGDKLTCLGITGSGTDEANIFNVLECVNITLTGKTLKALNKGLIDSWGGLEPKFTKTYTINWDRAAFSDIIDDKDSDVISNAIPVFTKVRATWTDPTQTTGTILSPNENVIYWAMESQNQIVLQLTIDPGSSSRSVKSFHLYSKYWEYNNPSDLHDINIYFDNIKVDDTEYRVRLYYYNGHVQLRINAIE